MTPAGREDFAPTPDYLCGRSILSWSPSDTVDGRGVELLLAGGRRVRVDGAALKMLAAMAWRAER